VSFDTVITQAERKRKLFAIVAFYLVALGVSFAAAQLAPISSFGGFRIDGGLLIGIGPVLGTVLGCLILKQNLPSLFGHRFHVGLLALLAPIILTAVTGFSQIAPSGIAGLIFGASIVLYCLCEESGWRGFLTSNLAWLKDWHADLLSGALWFAWHFTFMSELYDPSYTIGFVAAIVAGAFGLAEARRRTGGFALAAGWHAAVKLLPIGPLAFGLIALLAILTWRSKPIASLADAKKMQAELPV
jgi:membrane protease YdiL (CAAX protease family)